MVGVRDFSLRGIRSIRSRVRAPLGGSDKADFQALMFRECGFRRGTWGTMISSDVLYHGCLPKLGLRGVGESPGVVTVSLRPEVALMAGHSLPSRDGKTRAALTGQIMCDAYTVRAWLDGMPELDQHVWVLKPHVLLGLNQTFQIAVRHVDRLFSMASLKETL